MMQCARDESTFSKLFLERLRATGVMSCCAATTYWNECSEASGAKDCFFGTGPSSGQPTVLIVENTRSACSP